AATDLATGMTQEQESTQTLYAASYPDRHPNAVYTGQLPPKSQNSIAHRKACASSAMPSSLSGTAPCSCSLEPLSGHQKGRHQYRQSNWSPECENQRTGRYHQRKPQELHLQTE